SIYLAEEGSPSCSIVSTRDLIKESFSIQANPNPVSYYTQIQVEAQRDSELELMVFNVLGRQVYQRNIQVFEGTNSFEFDASQLPEGMYLYAITDGKNILTKKMMVNR
ncbi:MAG: T9SS type A sorting domain-containing protein, partial [Bacteroidota bacterium]